MNLKGGYSVTALTEKKLAKLNSKQTEAIAGYLFIAPVYLLYIIFVLIPVVVMVFLSFTKYDILSPAQFINFDNYIELFKDKRFYTVLGNTFYFTIVSVILNVGIGLALAVALNRKMNESLRNAYRVSFFFPVIVSSVYISVIWAYLFSTDTGIINYYLQLVGIQPVQWFTNPKTAMLSIIFMDVWKNTGFAMVVFLAGLQNIPREFYESSQIDGANRVQTFFKITFPMLSPVVFFNVITFSIGALQVFDSTKIITDGGPGDSTRSMVMYIYEHGFRSYNMGYASSVSVVFVLIIVILTLFQFNMSKKWVHY
jgi:multiple sugar transport system permease protein